MPWLTEKHEEHAKLTRLRLVLAQNRAEHAQAMKAPRTKEEVRPLLIDAVTSGLARSDPGPRLRSFLNRTGMPPKPLDDPALNFGWLVLAAGGVEKFVDATLASLPFDDAVSEQDHQRRLEHLERKRIEIETNEELEILRLEHAGWQVDRRPDVDGKLLLEVWKSVPEAMQRVAPEAMRRRVAAPPKPAKGINDGNTSASGPSIN